MLLFLSALIYGVFFSGFSDRSETLVYPTIPVLHPCEQTGL